MKKQDWQCGLCPKCRAMVIRNLRKLARKWRKDNPLRLSPDGKGENQPLESAATTARTISSPKVRRSN